MSARKPGGWRKSLASAGNGNCVELGESDGGVVMRNSRDPQGAVLWFTRAELAAFLAAARSGEFDDLAQ